MGAVPAARIRHYALVPERVRGAVTLWDGWQLDLPNECMSDRNLDGSWSAWDDAHTVDVQIVSVGGGRDGQPIDAARRILDGVTYAPPKAKRGRFGRR